MFLLIAATAGLGGGNFASSMANISFFYPEPGKGSALGLNAAGGNIGVSLSSSLVPLVIGRRRAGRPAGLIWIPLVLARRGRRLAVHGQPDRRAKASPETS